MKDFLNYDGNFSKLSKIDLEDLLFKLKNYSLRYRKSLNVVEQVSFGIELEFEDILLYYVLREFKQNDVLANWFVHEDKSCSYKIDGFSVGGEVSSPILHDQLQCWEDISKALFVLKKLGAHSTDKTSLHVHVGSQIFGEEIINLVRFIKVWCVFEHVIYKFCYGKSSSFRPYIRNFAHPIADATKLKCKYIPNYLENMILPKGFHYDKKWGINFNNYHYLSSEEELNNTIEIRVANGSLERNIIQNTINLYLKLMLYASSDRYDALLIDRLFQKLKPKDLEEYDLIYLKDALILCDLIFDTSLDKINFLKQYIKKDELILRRK